MSVYYPQGALVLVVTWENFEGDPETTRQSTLSVLAKDFTVELNSYEEADTFNATLDYKSFPFDPRTIRAIQVTVCMDNMGSNYNSETGLRQVIIPQKENIIFLGFVDEESISFDDSNQSVSIEGRDYTSLFIDVKRSRPYPLPLKKRIDLIIQDLINEQQSTEKIILDLRGLTKTDLPTLSKVASNLNKSTGNKNPKKNETYWDIIKGIVRRSGLITYIDRDKLVLTKPQNIYDKNKKIQMIYGYNLKGLDFKRKIGRRKAQNVRVYSALPERKGKVSIMIPRDAISKDFIDKFGNREITVEQYDSEGKKIEKPKKAEVLSFSVPDVMSKRHLIKIGEGIFENISRQQLEGRMATKDMLFVQKKEAIRPDTKPEFDTVDFKNFRVGTGVEILIEKDDLEKIKSTKAIEDRIIYLLEKGYPTEVATEFANSLSKPKYLFYTKAVKFSLSESDGFSIDIDFINFIELDNKIFGRKTVGITPNADKKRPPRKEGWIYYDEDKIYRETATKPEDSQGDTNLQENIFNIFGRPQGPGGLS